MRLVKQQKAVLVGTLLGDGHLELNGSKVRLRIDHSEKQREYVEWKYEVFRNIAANKPRSGSVLDKRTKKVYQHVRFDTLSRDIFAEYRQIFYSNHQKMIPLNIKQLLKSSLTLAVWFMDDGHKRNDCRGLHINTQTYGLDEQNILRDCLKENFNVTANVHKQSGKYKLYIPSEESKKFCDLIDKHIIPSMHYKLL